jgi:hypothetical protein
VHCDLVLPAHAAGIDWNRLFPRREFAAVDDRCQWIAIGWGNRRFYLEVPTFADLDLGAALAAMSGLSSTALHVTWRWNGPGSDSRNRRFRDGRRVAGSVRLRSREAARHPLRPPRSLPSQGGA